MTPENVAARFDNRPGYRIVNYGLVGLPVFKITAIGLTLLKKTLDPIEEFAMRTIAAGLQVPSDVCGLLGLSERVIGAVLTDMISRENVVVSKTATGERLILTERGRRVVSEQLEIKPSEQTLPFTFDALIRKPHWYGESQLYLPKELRVREIPELRAFPDRAPELHELKAPEVADVLTLAAGRPEHPFTVLRITSIEKRVRFFMEAVFLAYRSEDGEGLQIAFALDGRLSEAHERAFAETKGLERNPIFRDLRLGRSEPELVEVLDPDLAKRVQMDEARGSRADLARARQHLAETKLDFVKRKDTPQEKTAEVAVQSAEEALDRVIASRSTAEVRALEVYEHAEILEDALTTSVERLMIISPWIRASVVNDTFLKRLEALLNRGVRVSIGFGLGTQDLDERPHDKLARERLEELSRRYRICTVRRLGDTHAKLLIKDRAYFVISSFNWLSFRGDRSKPFREELGTLVRIPDRVDELYDRMIARFESGPQDSLGEP